MSEAASWSYTAVATHWPLTGRDDWTGALTYGAPVSFPCDYKAESARVTDDNGVEFVARQQIYTEYDSCKQGDMVLIGSSSNPSPVAAGASEVRAVRRYADTFDRLRDDYEVIT